MEHVFVGEEDGVGEISGASWTNTDVLGEVLVA